MLGKRIVAIVLAGILFAAAGVAAAGNFASDRQVDFYSEGTHQFYMWCSGSDDYMASTRGPNAEEAQMSLYDAAKANGNTTCWPIWQGRAGG